MAAINERRLVEKARALGYVTDAQLEECFRAIDESPTHQTLPDVLLARGYLTEQQLRTIVEDPRGKTSATMMSVNAEAPRETEKLVRSGPPSGGPAAGEKRWTFGRYQVLEEIGRGGMGVVYRARDPELGRTIAIKLLLHEEEDSAEAVERFLREARAAANLNHPNIVHIHDIGVCEHRHYFTMDYVDGSSFDEMLDPVRLPTASSILGSVPTIGDEPSEEARTPAAPPVRSWPQLPPQEREKVVRKGISILAQIARALHQAHEQGIIHRDMKPENILVTSDGVPKLTDFGLAKEYGKGGKKKMTVTGTVMGTPWYMSPEQAAGEIDRLAPASDIFSLGVILYELVTGTRPFNEETVPATLHAVMEKDPIPPRRLAPSLHKDLQTVCLKALAKEPSRRYATALDFAQDLERFLAGEPISARPTSLTYLVWRRAAKHRTVASVVAVSVCVLLVGAAIAAWGWSKYRSSGSGSPEARLAAERQQRRRAAEQACAEGKARIDEVLVPLAQREFDKADQFLKEGLASFAKAIEIDPDYAEAYVARARSERLAGRPDPALADVEKAVTLVPGLPEALYLRAVLRVERYSGGILGDPSDATIVEEDAAKAEKEKALDDLRALSKADFRGLPAWMADHCRGTTALLEERYALAVDALAKVVQENATLWDVFFQKGLAHEKLSQWPEAQKCYSECLRRNPRHAAAWINRGRILTHTDTDQAVRDLTEGIKLEPNNSRAYYLRSHAYWHLPGRVRDSVADADKAIEYDPSFAAAYNQRGLAFGLEQKFDEAIRDYTHAIDLQKGVAEYYRNRASAELSKCYHDAALADCETVLKLAPKDGASWYLRGNWYLHMKQWEKAIADFTEALTRNPGHAESHVNKANAFIALNRFDEAIAECTSAINLHPTSDALPKAYFNRGVARYNKKDLDRAKADFEFVLRTNCGGELADQVRSWLDRIQGEVK